MKKAPRFGLSPKRDAFLFVEKAALFSKTKAFSKMEKRAQPPFPSLFLFATEFILSQAAVFRQSQNMKNFQLFFLTRPKSCIKYSTQQ